MVVLPQPNCDFFEFLDRVRVPALSESLGGVAAAPVALFALGVALSKTVFRAEPAVLVFFAIKLLVFPAAVWFALDATSYAADDAPVYVLAAAGPSVAMSFSLASLHDVRTDTIAQIMVWAGLLSLVSIAVLAWDHRLNRRRARNFRFDATCFDRHRAACQASIFVSPQTEIACPVIVRLRALARNTIWSAIWRGVT